MKRSTSWLIEEAMAARPMSRKMNEQMTYPGLNCEGNLHFAYKFVFIS